MKMQATIYAGIGEHADHSAISMSERLDALACIRQYLAVTFGGYTETAASGGWINGNGRLVKEPSVVFTFVTDGDRWVINAAGCMIAKALGQESVLVTIQALQFVEFVTQEGSYEQA